MKKFLLFTLIGVSGILSAQPVTSNQLPGIGTDYTFYQISGNITHGTTGANQTWNYNPVANSELLVYEIIGSNDLTQTDLDTFPLANYYTQFYYGGNPLGNDFYEITSTRLANHGSKGSGGNYNKNPMPIYEFEFGMNFNDEFTFAFFQGNTFRTVKYDSYGTLTTPYGTYTDVIRLKTTETGVGSTTDVMYKYYATQPVMHPLFQYVVETGGTVKNKFFYNYTNLVTGIQTTQNNTNFTIYPNPVQNDLNINFGKNKYKQVEVYTLLGEKVITEVVGSTTTVINTKNLSSGIYIIKAIDENNSVTTCKFNKN